ncbi:MAG: DUF1552 domain-containing protein [Planctomycetes bacterium]|nr:DUF1552 domain-containing protein [Planctomycetota bacterium]
MTTSNSWQLDRRTLLRGAGVAVALPWLEAMTPAPDREPGRREPVRRTCFVYFPNGCSLPDENDEKYRHWRWFPDGEGADFRFTDVLSCLEPYRDRLSVFGGLSHPLSRELLGHLAGDTWLTAGDLRGDSYKNRVSVDQVISRQLKQHTRYPSLVLSTDGGVGYKSRTATISFDHSGRPIPAECRQRLIFERYFAQGGADVTATRKESLRRGRRIVDLVLDDAKRLEQRLGRQDRDKLGQYLQSLDAVEEQLQRNEQWLDRPLPPFDSSHVDLDARADVDPTAYLRSMFDLMALALQLDLTRVVTFMTGREDGMGFGDSFPQRALGIKRGLHTISHDGHEGHWDDWGRYDQWQAQQFAYFVERLATVQDEHGPLLDTTQVLYGSCCSTTHNARNLPLLLVGGGRLGLRHGSYHRWDEKTPMCNLLLAMLRTATAGSAAPAETFGDATGALGGPFA